MQVVLANNTSEATEFGVNITACDDQLEEDTCTLLEITGGQLVVGTE